MSIALLGISFDAYDPRQLTAFWADALQRNVAEAPLPSSLRSPLTMTPPTDRY
jgi:hypothetical protein